MSLQEGKTINYTNGTGADIAGKTPLLIGVVLGVVVADIAAGETGAVAVEEVHEVRKITGEVTQGARLYWDADGDPVGGTAGSGALSTAASTGSDPVVNNTPVGFAVAAAASADAAVAIKLNA